MSVAEDFKPEAIVLVENVQRGSLPRVAELAAQVADAREVLDGIARERAIEALQNRNGADYEPTEAEIEDMVESMKGGCYATSAAANDRAEPEVTEPEVA